MTEQVEQEIEEIKAPAPQIYVGTKTIIAWPHTKPDGKEGYSVKYNDDYVSWSPKDVFEEAYRTLDKLDFGRAFHLMSKGWWVKRPDWSYHVGIENNVLIFDNTTPTEIHSLTDEDLLATDWLAAVQGRKKNRR